MAAKKEKLPVKRAENGRDEKGRFVVGNAGGGRKPVPDEVKEMLVAATPSAVQLLVDMMMDYGAPKDLRVRCAEVILNRVYGRPTQPICGDLSGGIVIALDDKLQAWAE